MKKKKVKGKNKEKKKDPLEEDMTPLVAQMVKHLPAVPKTQVQSLDCEDLLEKEMAMHTSILAWKNTMDGGAWWTKVHGVRGGHGNLLQYYCLENPMEEESGILQYTGLQRV